MRVAALLVAAALGASPAAAQTTSRPGPWALDIRGVTSPVPQDASFYPPLEPTALVPSRGFGIDLGAHVYLFNLGPSRVGIGARLMTVRSTARPPEAVAAPGGAPAAPRQAVQLDLQSVAPELSFNFGTRGGWSYVSAGLGRMHVRVRTTDVNPGSRETGDVGDLWEFWDVRRFRELREFGDLNVINVGGGARWFMKAHMGFTFDIRLYLVPAGTPGPIVLDEPLVDPEPMPTPPPTPAVVSTPSRMQFVVGAGLSFR